MFTHCLDCGDTLVGRIDKKFCDDGCRTSFHNKANRKSSKRVRSINRTLRRNQKILSYFYGSGQRSVPKERLIEMGFSFHIHTRQIKEDKQPLIQYSYDIGFVESSSTHCDIVLNQSDFRSFVME